MNPNLHILVADDDPNSAENLSGRLSTAALKTLSIVAYRQPAGRAGGVNRP